MPAVVAWLDAFDELLLPATVAGELLYGALNSARAAENVGKVEALATRCRLLPVTLTTSRVYAELRRELKTRGRPVPGNDLWIAPSCVEHGVPLATDDAHFKVISGLAVVGVP